MGSLQHLLPPAGRYTKHHNKKQLEFLFYCPVGIEPVTSCDLQEQKQQRKE